MKIRKKMSGGNADDMRIGDILCENVSFKFQMKLLHIIHIKNHSFQHCCLYNVFITLRNFNLSYPGWIAM